MVISINIQGIPKIFLYLSFCILIIVPKDDVCCGKHTFAFLRPLFQHNFATFVLYFKYSFIILEPAAECVT